jgi:hypothetical protein
VIVYDKGSIWALGSLAKRSPVANTVSMVILEI